MADYGITDEGFIIKSREQSVVDNNTKLQTAFGASFDVSPSSPDGQIVGIVADAIHECWLREEAAYNTFVPNKSFGLGLDDLVSINGITRIENQPTTVLCTLAGTSGLVIPAGSVVETVEGLQFTTNTTVALPNDVTATCTTLGAIPVSTGEVVIINADSAIVGWTSVNNTEDGITGIVRQTDAELRTYRESNTISRGVHTVDAIYQAVANLNLTHIFVDNNPTDGVVGGVPARTIHVVVEGGNRAEIAQAIFNNLPAGVPTYGSITETVLDSQGHPHDISLDRPTEVIIEVSATIVVESIAPSNTADLVQAAIVDYVNSLNVGDDLVWSSLFAPILAVPYVAVTSLTTALDGGTHDTVTLLIDSKSRAVTDVSNVVIT
jgi:uncharacterized phage protein gp47/JayE